MSTERFKNVTSFVINLLNNKNNYPAQSHGISSDFSRLGLRSRRLSIRRYSTRFRRIIVKYSPFLGLDLPSEGLLLVRNFVVTVLGLVLLIRSF